MEPVRIVEANRTQAATATRASHQPPTRAAPRAETPVPVVLTALRAQSLYAPLARWEPP